MMGGFAQAMMAAASLVQGMQQSREQEKYQRQAAAIQSQQAQAEIGNLEKQRAAAQHERQERLEHAQAAQRAAFAAGGVSDDGSGAAVFQNLLSQSQQEATQIDDDINRRIGSLQSGIQLNLLSRPGRSNLFTSLAGIGTGLYDGFPRSRQPEPQTPQPKGNVG